MSDPSKDRALASAQERANRREKRRRKSWKKNFSIDLDMEGEIYWFVSIAGLVLLLAGGFFWAWPNVVDGTIGNDQGFLQNLLSEGVGILVSVAIIAPLTAAFVERRRRRQLRPVRTAFTKTISARAQRFVLFHRDSTILFGTAATSLRLIAMNEKAIAVFASVFRATKTSSSSDDADADSPVTVAANGLAAAMTVLRDLQSHVSSLERSFEINASILPDHVVAAANDMLLKLSKMNDSYALMEQLVTGSLPYHRIDELKHATFDAPSFLRNIEAICDATEGRSPKKARKRGRKTNPNGDNTPEYIAYLSMAKQEALNFSDEQDQLVALIQAAKDVLYAKESAEEEETINFFENRRG